MFDLDGFKGINDTHGHDTGDAVLKAVGSRLKERMRDSDCFARLGGDEFAILTTEQIDAAGLELLCERIVQCFVEPVRVGALSLRVALSVGAVLYPAGGNTEDDLYKSADLALYRAKRGGRNGWSW